MHFYELVFIAIGLSMDAFAVSITKGLGMPKVRGRHAAWVGAWFGAFQALMPSIGFLLGARFLQQIEAVDHWVAFVILAVIGANMIREALKEAAEETAVPETDRVFRKMAEEDKTPETVQKHVGEEDPGGQGRECQEVGSGKAGKEQKNTADLRVGTMLLLAVATSIDALAVGITFALLKVRIVPAALFIGCMTFAISFGGVYTGHLFGSRYKKSASLAGGAILILIGLKILLEHLGILA